MRFRRTRPRKGLLVRRDGTEENVKFIRTEQPGEYRPVRLDGTELRLYKGDMVQVDCLGPGQTVYIVLHTP